MGTRADPANNMSGDDTNTMGKSTILPPAAKPRRSTRASHPQDAHPLTRGLNQSGRVSKPGPVAVASSSQGKAKHKVPQEIIIDTSASVKKPKKGDNKLGHVSSSRGASTSSGAPGERIDGGPTRTRTGCVVKVTKRAKKD
jgi:hypothetical protein